jgi:pyruvate/2-oxoglutarate dehydrogenase complex dihydrolipoamide dehydrogenase (E3) component
MKEEKGRGRYNVVVIGAGTAGLVTAAGTAGLGGRVALVERNRMGGDCLNTGCVPSKALIASARVAHRMRHASSWGLPEKPLEIALGDVLKRMRARRDAIAPHDSQERFESLGVDVFRGAARFVSPHEVDVDGVRLRAVNFVIATGARATLPPIPGLAEAHPFTHETVFDALPDDVRRLAVIGGGPIGCELGQAFARLGVEVTILEAGPGILASEDDDVRSCVQESLIADGVRLHVGVRIAQARKLPTGATRLEVDGGAVVDADAVLVAAGRKPDFAALDLEAAGVAVDEEDGRLVTDPYLRSATQPHIFAVGDVIGGPQLTSLADHHARVVVRNILFPWVMTSPREESPVCTFTAPEIARLGFTEGRLRGAARPYDVLVQPFADVDRSIVESEDRGFAKVLLEKGRDRILGVAVVGEHAGELIHEYALAMRLGRGLAALGRPLHAYPTRAEAARRLADQYQRRRLTPRVQRIFQALYRWRRRGA